MWLARNWPRPAPTSRHNASSATPWAPRSSAWKRRSPAPAPNWRKPKSRTLIHSPISGLVGQRSARNGQYVQVGTHLLSLVPDEDIWVQANFKETQVGRMRDGQKARLTFDAFPDTPIDGRIDSLFAASGAQFSLLPPDNATGNFTKVVQRIPVKIVFEADNPLHGRIRPGMSVEAEVELRDR